MATFPNPPLLDESNPPQDGDTVSYNAETGTWERAVLDVWMGDGRDGDVTVSATTETTVRQLTHYDVGALVGTPEQNGHRYRCTVAGTTQDYFNIGEPDWPLTPGATVADGTVTWQEDGVHLLIANRLQRDVYAETLHVLPGVDLEAANFRIFAKVKVLNEGTICNDGASPGWTSPGNGTFGQHGAHGGDGSTGVGDGSPGDAGGGALLGCGPSGKGGDAGAHVGGAAGSATAAQATVPTTLPSAWLDTLSPVFHAAGNPPGWFPGYFPAAAALVGGYGSGSGAGGGASDSAGGDGGDGGGAAGPLVIFARRVENTGIIRSEGGYGEDASGTGNAGGGGGGPGNFCLVFCRQFSGNAPVAPGGDGGAGIGTGHAGDDGGPGVAAVVLLP